MSPVFTAAGDGGAGGEVPPVFVDRFGIKGWTSHCGGQDNKVEHALMLQRINTCDENGETGAGTGAVDSGFRTNEGFSVNGNPFTVHFQGHQGSHILCLYFSSNTPCDASSLPQARQ